MELSSINLAGGGINTILSLAGVILYFAWKVRPYIGSKFDFDIFKKENKNSIVWSIFFTILLNIVILFSPQSVEFILNFFGVSLDIIDGSVTNASPIIIGIAIASVSRDMNKDRDQEKE